METFYWILFISYASYAFNRKSVVFSMPKMKEEGLDASHAGLIISCQNVAFAISKFLVGILSDRLNPYLIFATGLFVSGVATIIFSSSYSVTTFCCLWFLNGLAQGCGWPPLAKILKQKASASEFGTLWSFLESSNNFSGILGPFLSAFFIVNFGWRWNVFFAGFMTLFLCAFFLYKQSIISSSSNSIAQDKRESSPEKKCEKIAISTLFLDPYICLLSWSLMIVFSARTTTIDWGQMYLLEERSRTQYVASAFTSSVEIGGLLGSFAGGYITDWVIKRNSTASKQGKSSKPQLRMAVAMVFMFVNVIAIHLFRFTVSETSSSLWIMSVGALMGMSYYGPIAIFGIVSSECVPSHSGASQAVVALFGNIGATISGLPFSFIAKLYHWSTVFIMLEIVTAGTLVALVRWRNLTPNIGKPKEE